MGAFINPLRVVAAAIVFSASAALLVAQDQRAAGVRYSGPLSTLNIPGHALGPGWTGPSGLVVDDFQDLRKHAPEVQSIITDLAQQLKPLGVTAVADFTYEKPTSRLAQVTVRVFLFDSEKSCREWWARKYGYAGWEQHYRVAPGLPYVAVDSTQMNKRALMFGNVWITSGNIQDSGNEHLRAAELYVKKIQTTAATTD